MQNTKIEWCDHTFNPWVGCSKVHAGCANCYAEELMATRFRKVQWGPHGSRRITSEATWRQPKKWDKAARDAREAWAEECAERDSLVWPGKPERPRVFCGSLCDWAEDWRGPLVDHQGRSQAMNDVRFRLLDLAAECRSLDWLFLTKRPERVAGILSEWSMQCLPDAPVRDVVPSSWWFGASVSDQETADRLVPQLLRVREVAPHSKLFVSAEPLLGPIDWHLDEWRETSGPQGAVPVDIPDWIIVGGESGRNARPCNLDWIRDTVEQCQSANVPVFVKQLGSHVIGWLHDRLEMTGATDHATGYDSLVRWKLRDPKGGDPSEWPEDLCVREVP